MSPEPLSDPYPYHPGPLLIYPDPRLQIVCDPIPPAMAGFGFFSKDSELHKLLDLMWDTLMQYGGIGLAAPQVGSTCRAIIGCVPHCCTFEIINPVIVKRWGGSYYSDEGCLSFPGKRVRMRRDKFCRVEGFDRHGIPSAFSGRNLQAACIQHEIDHLDGINIAD